MRHENYVLVVVETHRPEGAPGGTGGTLSNDHLFRSIGSRVPVRVITFDDYRCPDLRSPHHDVTFHSRPSPSWRRLALVRHWIPFVRAQVGAFVERYGVPKAVIATTSTVPSIDSALLRGAPSAAIIQAFENFGLRAPGVTRPTRVALAKQALVRWFRDAKHIRAADVVAANSYYMAGEVERRLRVAADRLIVLPQLCDVTPSEPAPRGVIGFVNRSEDKNLAFVLRLARRASHYRFEVFGGPPYTGSRPPNVEFLGWESDRNRMFSRAGLWIVPSKWPEPFGRVSMEAQAADRPVLVARVGGLPETVVDDRYVLSGYVDSEWLARMRDLLALPGEVVAANGARVRKAFCMKSYEDAITRFLDRLLNHDRALSARRVS